MAPDAECFIKVPTMMTTADMALKIVRNTTRYPSVPKPRRVRGCICRAWFKLLHRDMGQKDVILAPKFRRGVDMARSVPAGNASYDVESVKAQIKDSGLTTQEMVEIKATLDLSWH